MLCLTRASSSGAAPRKFADFERFPQDGASYLPANPDAPIADYVNQVVYAEEYLRRHFAPWQAEDFSFLDLTFEKISDFHKSMARRQYYTPDGKPFPRKSMDAIVKNGAVDEKAPPRPGVALNPADVRVFPHEKPLYESQASAAGANGRLKLDVLQNSVVRPGEPLAVYNASGDSNWLFVATGTVVGWVKASSVSLVDDDFMDMFVFSEKSVTVRDNVRVTGEGGKFLFSLKMGTVLPMDGDELLLPMRGKNGLAAVTRYRPPEGVAAPFPVRFTPRNAASAIEQMMGEPYGWGGASGFRDCSAMTRDYFSLFGVWIPRNSGDQSITGARISLKNTPSEERSGVIVSQAVPFATLIHMPGHIMLYIGVYDGEPVVFHNTWGVRAGAGRAVVGRAVVSSLKLGAEIPDKPDKSLLLDRIDAMSFPMADLASAEN
ncbi:MAG: SH3 domain-containing protein [Synergistaceae bacterium]|nr:SH3 domain-containing protein [Synergistaceae bacterium]